MTASREDPRLTLMRWHLAMGVDETIGESPIDRFAAPAAGDPPTAESRAVVSSADSPPAAPPARARRQDGPPPEPKQPMAGGPAHPKSLEDAVAAAAAADTLDALRETLSRFEGCALKQTATNLVFGDGAASARVVFIGEAPGAEEDRQGVPFVGPSGQLLDRMLQSIGLDRSQVFISNTIFWRPPGNRSPSPSETVVCKPFVRRIIELVAPEVLVTLGAPAAQTLLDRTESIGRLRGRWFEYHSERLIRPIPATAVYHPAYLLRTPGQKRLAWRDFLMIRERLDGAGTD